MEILLKYHGKKLPFITPPIIKNEYTFVHDPVWVPEAIANALMSVNPKMFSIEGNRDAMSEAVNQEPLAPQPSKPVLDDDENILWGDQTGETYVCEKCGKDYKVKHFYEKHISKCEGPVND